MAHWRLVEMYARGLSTRDIEAACPLLVRTRDTSCGSGALVRN